MSRFFLIAALLFSGVTWGAQDAATALVQDVSERMLATLEKRRAEIDRNPSVVYALVDDILVPHFDFDMITQSAVGRHWREASAEQKQALTEGFREVLIRTYATTLLSYSGEEIRYLPVKPGKRESTVTVSTEVRDPGGAAVPVDYRMHNKAGPWKVYDVVIDNVSLISNYRSNFNTQIRRDGIDGLIRRLGEMNTKGQA
jgi:phospholipid transport system substrate-binding protein